MYLSTSACLNISTSASSKLSTSAFSNLSTSPSSNLSTSASSTLRQPHQIYPRHPLQIYLHQPLQFYIRETLQIYLRQPLLSTSASSTLQVLILIGASKGTIRPSTSSYVGTFNFYSVSRCDIESNHCRIDLTYRRHLATGVIQAKVHRVPRCNSCEISRRGNIILTMSFRVNYNLISIYLSIYLSIYHL
ncbi:unnamed protein product [Acanthosepion pharaonis]|uniref:Uncharacterized protein n=1 Tax=Acanthosepion pharaonis TaxID=158019 RepID=A0A812CMW8_ACAPH|nr:unnamed protein product [Sepia pharaonis]